MDVRKLVYQNVACGVPPERVAQALGITEEQAQDAFAEVGLKLAGYQVFESMPYVCCQTPTDAMQNRIQLLVILETLDLDVGKVACLVRVNETKKR